MPAAPVNPDDEGHKMVRLAKPARKAG